MCVLSSKEKGYRIQSILERFFAYYLRSPDRKLRLEDYHLKAVHQIRSCRTARLGVYHYSCESCGQTHALARSCKHRFCSRCGQADTHRWAERMLGRLLEMKHHHVVFTLPKALRWLSKRNGVLLHNLLFKVSSEVLKEWFWHKHELRCGLVSVLHTNGSQLNYHPHVHMIVTAGGMDGSGRVVRLSGDYLCNAKWLGGQFKRKFIAEVLKLYKKGGLEVAARLDDIQKLGKWLRDVGGVHNWIVHIEKSLPNVSDLIRYVGRYTKRSCISERRILGVGADYVEISYKDYKNSERGGKPKESRRRYKVTEFLDALLQHLPPPGYKVVRYYGIYGTSEQMHLPQEELRDASEYDDIDFDLLEEQINGDDLRSYRKYMFYKTGRDPLYCYDCHQEMVLIEILYEKAEQLQIELEDSS